MSDYRTGWRSNRTGWRRVLVEDLPHAVGGAFVSAGVLALGGAALLGLAAAALVGALREWWQMARSGDEEWGLSRWRDLAGWVVGAVVGEVMWCVLF